MSKKSRKRNKKILAAIGIGLGTAALASKRKADLASTEDGKSAKADRGFTMADVANTAKKDTVKPEAKPIVVKDTGTKYRSRMLRSNPLADGKVMGPGETGRFNAKNKMPNMAPPSIDNPYSSRVIKGRFGNSKKDGGRMGLKSGGKVKKSMGKALRGGGKVMR
jgi:hypothetical protein